MATRGTAFLMYHELGLPGRAMCHSGLGYSRYVVPESDFRNQMERLSREGWRGRNVTQAIESFDDKSVCITFDDGCETDLISAAPVLKKVGFGATSYITVKFLGKPGYMSHTQVRELYAMGFEIGCHSLTHPYLTDVDDNRLHEETAVAKDSLEQIAGVRVNHFSCPGGRWDARVMRAVKRACFRTMATSRTGVNLSTTDPFALTRVTMLNGTKSDDLMRYCQGRGLLRTQLEETARDAAKRVLGNSIYDSLRGLVVRGRLR
ncbi:MAG TPA: polysaccharide deacetylase family protein [Candidatus Sulfotelmatobacter sp.]|nr:polysaccharide deacetylase family protein [Candidatus Sulfotelmatobacter sp.]